MREIIFCSQCKRKFHIMKDSFDNKYVSTDGNKHNFFDCWTCGAIMCDDCEKTHCCVKKEKKNEIIDVSKFMRDAKIVCHGCGSEQMKLGGMNSMPKEIHIDTCGHNCKFDIACIEKQVEEILSYAVHELNLFYTSGKWDSKKAKEGIRKILRGEK